MNDAPVVLAVVLLASDEPITWVTPLLVVYELGVGAALGLLLGRAGAWALRRAALPSTGLYPLAALAVCVLAYSAGQLAHASGLLATYVAALVLGNSNLPHRGDVLSFAEGTGWLAQIGLFVLLGLSPRPAGCPTPSSPPSSPGSCWSWPPGRCRWSPRRRRSGCRGASRRSCRGRGCAARCRSCSPLVAAQEGAPGAQRLVDVVFVLVVVLTLLQGTTLPSVARRLGVVAPGRAAGDRGRRRPARRAGRRPAAGPGARPAPGCAGSTCASCGCRAARPSAWSCATTRRSPRRATPGCGAGTSSSSSPRRRPGTRPSERIRAVDRAGRLARWHGESGR